LIVRLDEGGAYRPRPRRFRSVELFIGAPVVLAACGAGPDPQRA